MPVEKLLANANTVVIKDQITKELRVWDAPITKSKQTSISKWLNEIHDSNHKFSLKIE